MVMSEKSEGLDEELSSDSSWILVFDHLIFLVYFCCFVEGGLFKMRSYIRRILPCSKLLSLRSPSS